jgi:exodeoxyribonuclease V beta subunit
LLKWFARRRRETNGGEDEQKLRLESDAHAVRIITIHKSKGLQFDVVFCPFTWAGAKVDDELVAFHDPDRLAQPTLAIGPGIAPKHREWGLEEALAENLRLLYVAVTRARQSCYLVWGAIKGAELSAPAYLLHGPSDCDPAGSWTAPLKTKMAVLTDEQMVAELTTLAAASEGTIEVAAMPCPEVAPYTNPYKDQGELTQREFRGTIDTRWRISSFSALIAQNANAQGEFPDRDGPTSFTSAPELANSAMAHLFGFPKGAQAGLFFHDLLEHWDHCGNDVTERQRLVAAKLQAHRFAPEWQAAIDCFLVNLARVRLPAGTGEHTFSLADVAPGQRVNEMEFFFPLKQFNPDTLKQIFKKKGASLFAEGHVQHLDRLNFAPLQGFMKGYIDMVCAHDGRYYLIDWKSNYLGDTWEDYAWDRLNIVMAESFYFLQSHLYALALDLLLRRKIAEYDYKHHFGGVFYLFLRGIQGAHASTGIHHSVPEAELITALKEGLMPPSVSCNGRRLRT